MLRYIMAIGLVLLSVSGLATAQTAEGLLSYGEMVTGEITDRNFEVPFLFEGAKDDVVIVEMAPVESLGSLTSPQLIVLNSDNDVIADSSSSFSIGSTRVAVVLPADGEYTILATRADGRAGDSVGEFNLRLVQPTLLEEGKEVTGDISSNGGVSYAMIRAAEANSTLTYVKDDGDFAPEVNLNILDSGNSNLTSVVKLSGDGLSQITVMIPDEDIIIITIGEALFDFNFTPVEASISLTVKGPS